MKPRDYTGLEQERIATKARNKRKHEDLFRFFRVLRGHKRILIKGVANG